ncbi:MAG TPA: aminotransferase class V-fold PLP-dependent enzyme, partial [Gemmatimonadales bacterium]
MTVAMTAQSVAAVRRQFPAFQRQINGKPVAYFDAPGGTQVPESVANRVREYLLHHNANTHWAFPTSNETDAMLVRAREAAADLLGASAGEIAFGANMTTLTFHIARALGRQWGPGDEVIVTELDHHANVAPWRALAKERGVTIRTVPLAADRRTIDMAAFEGMLGPRTRLVAMGAASNAVGTITDPALVAQLVHGAGALLFTDAVHFVPHELVDVRAMGSDFLACSAYKFCGPHVGLLYVRKELAEQLDVPKLEPAPDSAPERFETGTLNHEGIAGVEA